MAKPRINPLEFKRPDTYNAEGQKLCRFIECHNPVLGRRRNWCSDACVHQYKLLSNWSYIRRAVRKRDKGICALCNTNTVALKSGLKKLLLQAEQAAKLGVASECVQLYQQQAEVLKARGFHGFVLQLPSSYRPRKHWKAPKDLWEADHIVAVVDGGGNQLSNLRTLCHPCHKAQTQALRVKRRILEAIVSSP